MRNLLGGVGKSVCSPLKGGSVENRYLLFYRNEGTNFSDYTLIVKWCSVYGVIPIVIDLDERSPRELDRPPFNFRSLETALSYPLFQDLTWIWLDHRADHYWDEIELPKENIIYCIGHDIYGFGGHVGDNLIKVKSPNKKMEPHEWFASMVAPMLLFEVYQR